MVVTGWAFVIIALALFAGAMLQGIIGFGMVILAFPVIVTVGPEILPQTALVASMPMVILMAFRNWGGGAVWNEVAWFTAGRPLGLVGATVLLATLSRDALSVAGGITVLVAIALSFWAPKIDRTKIALTIGGFISALFGTAISIGGPPIGLLYQHEEGPLLRSTVSLIMLFGGPVSLLTLIATGNVTGADVRTGVALMPIVLAGNISSRFVIPYFDERLRPVILAVSGIAAVIAVGRVILG